MHRSGSLQILSDAIAHIMAKKGVKLHCYIDDYIVVTSKLQAIKQCSDLCDLLHELGIPLDKLSPPTKKLMYSGIDIDIDNNTISNLFTSKSVSNLLEYLLIGYSRFSHHKKIHLTPDSPRDIQ